jgi:hypothetical protein
MFPPLQRTQAAPSVVVVHDQKRRATRPAIQWPVRTGVRLMRIIRKATTNECRSPQRSGRRTMFSRYRPARMTLSRERALGARLLDLTLPNVKDGDVLDELAKQLSAFANGRWSHHLRNHQRGSSGQRWNRASAQRSAANKGTARRCYTNTH